jgi:hypothetical protein
MPDKKPGGRRKPGTRAATTKVETDWADHGQSRNQAPPHTGQRLQVPPGFIDSTLFGTPFANHPLVAQRYFYSLPDLLFTELRKELGKDSFTAEELSLEDQAISRTDDCSTQVGFINGQPLSYNGLASYTPWKIDYEWAKACGHATGSKAKWEAALKSLDEWFLWNEKNRRAYCGWLLSNPSFLDEHDALLRKWMPLAARLDMKLLGRDLPFERFQHASAELTEETWKTCDSDFKSFLERWRLQSLAAPYLPNLIEPTLTLGEQVPANFFPRSGTLYLSVPDISPIPPEPILRPMMEKARKEQANAEHLTEWFDLVSIHTNRKKSFESFIRRFEVMHYWRAFSSRHGAKIRLNRERINTAFATYLGIDPSSVNRHLVELKKRIGSDWATRGQEFFNLGYNPAAVSSEEDLI